MKTARSSARHMFFIGLMFSSFNITTSSTLTQLQDLHTTMFAGYNRKLLPLLNHNLTVFVNIQVYITSLNDFDELSGVITTSLIFFCEWKDERLNWTPEDYGGAIYIYVAAEDIWRPQIYGIQLAEKIEAIGNISLMLKLFNNGTVFWNPGMVIKSTCAIDVTYFPFDEQNCVLDFTPWGFSKDDLVLNATEDTVQLPFLTENSEWEILTSDVVNKVKGDSSFVSINFNLKRRSEFYTVYIVYPLTFLSLLNICVFLMPSSSGERMSVAVTLFLSFIVYMGIVNDNVPSSSRPLSFLYFYLLYLMVLSTFIMILCICSLRIYDLDRKLPDALVKMTKILRFRCLKRFKSDRKIFHSPDEDIVVSLTEFPIQTNENAEIKHVDENLNNNDIEEDNKPPVTWKLVGQTFDLYCFSFLSLVHIIVSTTTYFKLVYQTI